MYIHLIRNFPIRILTQYLNADGYYNVTGSFTYAKPWDNRKYTLTFTGTVNYTNSVSYLTSMDSARRFASNTEKNISKNLQIHPGRTFQG